MHTYSEQLESAFVLGVALVLAVFLVRIGNGCQAQNLNQKSVPQRRDPLQQRRLASVAVLAVIQDFLRSAISWVHSLTRANKCACSLLTLAAHLHELQQVFRCFDHEAASDNVRQPPEIAGIRPISLRIAV